MASRKRPSKRRRTVPAHRIRISARILFWTCLVLLICCTAGYVWYRLQDQEKQQHLQSRTLAWLDDARDSTWLPPQTRFILDWIAEQIPLSRGPVVHADAYAGDRTHVYGGLPHSDRNLTVLVNQGYLVGYDEQRRNPAWVAYRVFPPQSFTPPQRPEEFQVDRRTRARVHPRDYSRSGYDRGHMAPNLAIALLYGPEAQQETFLMSNILPQSPELNRNVWKQLEARIIRNYAPRFQEVWVITGPIYRTPPRAMSSGVSIPEACFKILLDEHDEGLRTLSFIIPQDVHGDEDPARFLTSVREIERRTGLNFFNQLPENTQEKLETVISPRLW